ncbi:MAG: 5-formyltetrahydrofolate cyclo-ligase [Pseudomonadota bacterium]
MPSSTASCTEPLQTAELQHWRAAGRAALVQRRVAMPLAQRRERQYTITRLLTETFAGLRGMTVAGYWPFRGEFDPRPAMRCFRQRGARLALPMVVRKAAPLQFGEWWPGATLCRGTLGLPVPDGTARVVPQVLLIPLVGFDAKGYRLGLGGGYFDRTLAAMQPQPLKIGVGFELSRLTTIHPQSHDVPMDFIVTEAGVRSVGADGLRPVAHAEAVTPWPDDQRSYSSPVCYGSEFEAFFGH